MLRLLYYLQKQSDIRPILQFGRHSFSITASIYILINQVPCKTRKVIVVVIEPEPWYSSQVLAVYYSALKDVVVFYDSQYAALTQSHQIAHKLLFSIFLASVNQG